MGRAYYSIVKLNGSGHWAIRHDGKLCGDYATKEAAFEAAVGPASNAIKQGLAVTISVDGTEAIEPML
jgi:hypothetical protein